MSDEKQSNANNPISINSSITFAEQITKLTDGLELISNELQSQVREQHGALLSQASHASKITIAIDTVNGHMERLKYGADKLKQQVNQPFQTLENQTKVLERLHDASDLLRQSGKFLQIFRKLQQSAKDPIQQANYLYEFESLIDDEKLNRIEFVREEKVIVLQIRHLLNNLANRDLIDGLKNDKHNQVINSLQVKIYENSSKFTSQ